MATLRGHLEFFFKLGGISWGAAFTLTLEGCALAYWWPSPVVVVLGLAPQFIAILYFAWLLAEGGMFDEEPIPLQWWQYLELCGSLFLFTVLSLPVLGGLALAHWKERRRDWCGR